MTEPAAMSNLTAFLFVLMEASGLKVLCKQCFKCIHGYEETDEDKDSYCRGTKKNDRKGLNSAV